MLSIIGIFLVFSRKFALLSSCASHITTSAPTVSYPYLMVVTFKDDLTDAEKLLLTKAAAPYIGVDTSYSTDKFIKVDSNPIYVDTKTGFLTMHISPNVLNDTEIEGLKETVASLIPNLLSLQNNVDNIYFELTQLNANGLPVSALRRFFSDEKLKYFLDKTNFQRKKDIPEEYKLMEIY